MTHSHFQIDRQGDEEGDWWELWDRRQQMAVAQVLCYVLYAIYMLRAYYEEQCKDSVMSKKDRKRKACTWERKFENIKEAINDVADANREGNAIMEKSQ